MSNDTVTCAACNGSGRWHPGIAGCSLWGSVAMTTTYSRDCIPCSGSGRIQQRYPVRA